MVRVERPHHPRRDDHEERRQGAEAEQRQPEEARGDPPGALALPSLEQVAEDGDEGRREGGVGDERADGVRDEEGDLECVDGALHAEVVLGHHLADEAEHARDTGGERDDRGRPREPAAPAAGRRKSRGGGGIGRLAGAGRLHLQHDTRRHGRDPSPRRTSGTILGPAAAGLFTQMANIRQQKKRIRIAGAERVENLRYRSTIKTLSKRLAAAVEGGDSASAETEHRNLVKWIDRAVSRGALHRNAAARKKSQAARLFSRS